MTRPAEVSSCQAIVLESVINMALNIHCSFLLLIYQILISDIFALQFISVINFTCTGNNQKLNYSVITVLHHLVLLSCAYNRVLVVVLLLRHRLICLKIHSGVLYLTCLQEIFYNVSFAETNGN